MITAAQLRAARALLGLDQKDIAEMSGVSLPTIQRMEASDGNVKGMVDTLTKVVQALQAAGHRADCRSRAQRRQWSWRAASPTGHANRAKSLKRDNGNSIKYEPMCS